jgi:SAM-dependent methyltransferase
MRELSTGLDSLVDRYDDAGDACDAAQLVAYLQWIDSPHDVRARRRRSYELLELEPADRVAEVGCGIGTAVRELVERGVAAIGFDASPDMVEQARRLAPGAQFAVADVDDLPLPDRSFDGYRAERVYQHLDDPAAALEEAARVLRPGGRVVLVDQDWEAFVVDGDDPFVTRVILQGFCDSLPGGRIGRRLRRLLAEAGFDDVHVEADTVTMTDYEQLAPLLPSLVEPSVGEQSLGASTAEAWLEDQRRRGEDGVFFAAMTHFLAAARAS